MTPSRKDDDLSGPPDEIDEEPPRSLFAARWFRVVLVSLVIGVVAAISVPWVLDHVSPPAKPPAVAKPPAPAGTPGAPAGPPAAPAGTPTVAPPAATLQAAGNKSAPAASAPATAAPPVSPAATAAPSAPSPAPAPRTAAEPPAKAPAKSTAGEAGGRESAVKERKPARAETKPATKATGTEQGDYWVQVGAFGDPEKAKRVATALRQLSFNVSESTTTARGREAPAAAAAPPAPSASVDRYDVYVSGAPSTDLGAKLTAKGLSVDPAAEGVVVRPSLPLRDAVTLSKELAVDGLKVQVKRARAADTGGAPPAAVAGGGTLYRVRVGPFHDRTAAEAAIRQLEEKGYKEHFIALGGA